MDAEEKEMCMNCKRDISVANYQMHTAHCARHITLCQNCDEPIPKKEFPDHRCGGGGGDTEGPTSVSGLVQESPEGDFAHCYYSSCYYYCCYMSRILLKN